MATVIETAAELKLDRKSSGMKGQMYDERERKSYIG